MMIIRNARVVTPGRDLGITDRGEIAAGQIADLVPVGGDLDPQMTFAGGNMAWTKGEG